MRGFSKTLVTMCALILVMSFAGSAFAQDNRWQVTATNNSGAIRTDLHVLFINTGSNIANAKITVDGGTGAGVITVIGGNEIKIDWAPNNLPIGNSVTFQFTTPKAENEVDVNAAWWTPGDVALPAGDYEFGKKVPSLSQWGLVALLMLLIGAAFYAVRRRRCVPTA